MFPGGKIIVVSCHNSLAGCGGFQILRAEQCIMYYDEEVPGIRGHAVGHAALNRG